MPTTVAYEFGPFRLDPAKRLLLRADGAVALSPKAFDSLIFLIEHRDRVVKKDELIGALWPDVAVQDSSLSQLIFMLRKALDPQADGREYIVTASRYGYRFVAPVNVIIPADDARADHADSAGTGAPALADHPSRWPSARSARRWSLVLLPIAAAVLAAGFAYRHRAPSDIRPIRVFIRPPENTLPSEVGDVESPPIISRDGRQIAFVARTLDGRRLLWVRPLDTLTARPLPGTEDSAEVSPFWSPDGRSLAFVTGRRLKRIDIDGRGMQVLADDVSASPGTWNRDGTILFSRGIGIYRVSAAGGPESLVISRRHPDEFLFDPQFLPDGRHFLVYAVPSTVATSHREVRLAALHSKDTRTLLTGSDLSAVQYSSPFLIFMRGGRVEAQRFDPVKLTLSGEAVAVPEQVSYSQSPGYAALSASDTGVLVYRTGAPVRTHLTWFDRGGHALAGVDTPPGRIFNYSLSPDGQHVAALIEGPSRPGEELWLLSLSGAPPQRLPYAAGHVGGAVWSRDGSHIAFLLDEGGREGAALMRQDLKSSALPERLFRSPHFLGVTDWSRDDRFVLLQFEDTKFVPHIWTLPLFGDRRPAPLVNTGQLDTEGQLSPDGRWLVYRSRESGRDQLYLKRLNVEAPPWQVSTNGGSSPRWRSDGKELYYLQYDRSLMAVQTDGAGDQMHTQSPNRLFDVHVRICGCFNFVPSADGQRFLVNAFPNFGESQALVVVLNWAADLERMPR